MIQEIGKGVLTLIDFAISAYTDMLNYALPIAFVFQVGNLIVRIILESAFGGRLKL